jgi:hypothetical protein
VRTTWGPSPKWFSSRGAGLRPLRGRALGGFNFRMPAGVKRNIPARRPLGRGLLVLLRDTSAGTRGLNPPRALPLSGSHPAERDAHPLNRALGFVRDFLGSCDRSWGRPSCCLMSRVLLTPGSFTRFFGRPELVDIWGLGGPGGPRTLQKVWGLRLAPFGRVLWPAGAALPRPPKSTIFGLQKNHVSKTMVYSNFWINDRLGLGFRVG